GASARLHGARPSPHVPNIGSIPSSIRRRLESPCGVDPAMTMMEKYPRTLHIEGSRLQPGDEDLTHVPLRDLQGLILVIEEKMDGANCGISFAEDGRMLLQSRGHYLTGS